MAASDRMLQNSQLSENNGKMQLRQPDYRSMREEIKRLRLEFENCPPKVSDSEVYCRYCDLKDDHDSTKCPDVDRKRAHQFPRGWILHKPAPLRFNIKEHARDNTILIQDLPEDTCEAELVKQLETFGPLREVRVKKDETTGMCVGFAFASFQSIDDAEKAMNKFNADGYETEWLHGFRR